jgi:hypothetical protein
MKKLMLGLLVFGLATQFMFSQTVELPEVRLDVNYKYLDAITSEQTPEQVKILENEVAFFNLKESNVFSDGYETFEVSFQIPEGKIVAAYNKDGKILRTIERFKNVELPRTVIESIGQNYPNWRIVEDAYKVDYYDKSGIAKKEYKIKLENGDKKKTVKFDVDVEFL